MENKLANSKLKSINLEEFISNDVFIELDIANFLDEGLILKEKAFRKSIAEYDFSYLENKIVALTFSTDALFPEWAYLLLYKEIYPYSNKVYVGAMQFTKQQYLLETLSQIDYANYQDEYLVIKGCNNSVVTPEHLLYFYKNALPFAKSIMFGEACSSVPLYKKKS